MYVSVVEISGNLVGVIFLAAGTSGVCIGKVISNTLTYICLYFAYILGDIFGQVMCFIF